MPTILRQFPEVSRAGTQQTAYLQFPARFDTLHLTGQASAAVLSNPANAITFEVLASPTGQDADAVVIQREQWSGQLITPKGSSTPIPNPIDIAFGLDARHAGDQVALRATFNQQMVVGATLTGLP